MGSYLFCNIDLFDNVVKWKKSRGFLFLLCFIMLWSSVELKVYYLFWFNFFFNLLNSLFFCCLIMLLSWVWSSFWRVVLLFWVVLSILFMLISLFDSNDCLLFIMLLSLLFNLFSLFFWLVVSCESVVLVSLLFRLDLMLKLGFESVLFSSIVMFRLVNVCSVCVIVLVILLVLVVFIMSCWRLILFVLVSMLLVIFIDLLVFISVDLSIVFSVLLLLNEMLDIFMLVSC